MNFFDSLFEKIPILRDIDRKKRKMAAIFFVFVIISIIGIVIDAILEAGGAIALTAVAVGFLLMAIIIVADFILSKKKPKEEPPPVNDEQYSFFDDSPDDTAYQNESYDYYNANDGPQKDVFGDEMYENDYHEEFTDNGARYDDYHAQELEYTVEPDPPREEPAPKRFGGIFRRGQSNESTAISDDINGYSGDPRDSYSPDPQDSYAPNSRNDYEPAPRPSYEHAPESGYVGQPVMNFTNSPNLRDEVTMTANTVAPHVTPPPPKPELVGGPVMSIPSRGGYTPAPEPVQQPAAPRYIPPTPTPIQTEYRAEPAYPPAYGQTSGRGKEIEEFFDNMSEDELLYSDCVEVWAADAKPAAIRLLKQVESLNDKKMADSLGREAEYINAMLDRIYYFTMLDSIRDNLELKKYNFSAVVKECLRRFSPFFMEKRIGLLWKGLDIDIITDKRWLIFALTQVVFNAVEFTGLGGKIAISAKKEGSLIHLMVDDNGCGISEEELPHIFMAGFMGDNVPNESGRRTGMGLFITRSVVEKLGGSVTVESTIGKGTRVTIILPEKP